MELLPDPTGRPIEPDSELFRLVDARSQPYFKLRHRIGATASYGAGACAVLLKYAQGFER